MASGDFRLPNEVWYIVLEYLDAESLLAIEKSRLLSWSVFAERKLRRRITLSPHSDPAKLAALIAHVPLDDVKVLHLTNCLLACPVKLLECTSVCRQLTELYCVNCRLSLSGLFNVVGESLPALERLEFSIFSDDNNAQDSDFMAVDWDVVTNLRYMYVEVTSSQSSYALLPTILDCCPHLEELHVHILGMYHLMAFELFCEAICDGGHIRIFKYTNREGNQRVMSMLYAHRWGGQNPSSDCLLSSLLCGNATYGMHPNSYSNCLYLSEVIAGSQPPDRNLQQAILGVEVDDATPVSLAQAANQPLWRRLEALTVAVVPAHVIRYWRSPYVGSEYLSPLRDFLGACKVLTELNVNFVHFTAEVDFIQILADAKIDQLRALSLTPCAAQSPASVHQLAVSCPRLEELDVRDCHEIVGQSCLICHSPFTAVNEETMKTLHEETRLQCLTLLSHGLCSLDFLINCRVARLQIYWRGELQCSDRGSLGQQLGVNPHLRSATFVCPGVTMRKCCSELYLGELCSLQSLCVVTGVREEPESTERSVLNFARSHPSLETLHAHYVDERGSDRGIAWIRRWRDNIQDGQQQAQDDAIVEDAPCMLDCLLSTYIGLAKPSNQMGVLRY